MNGRLRQRALALRGREPLWSRRLRRELHSIRGQYPSLYFPVERALRPRHRAICVAAEHDLVIEGYPRSSNSFTVAAFRLAQDEDYRIAHHLHVPAQVVRACDLGLPCLLLVRRPRDAVLSRAVFTPEWTLGFLIRDYLRFHRTVMPHRAGFVVATFEQTTTDFGRVIRRVNDRFGTAFEPFDHTEANVKRVFASMEAKSLRDRGAVDERAIARPSSQRESLKARLRDELERPKLRAQLAEAEQLYRRLAAFSA